MAKPALIARAKLSSRSDDANEPARWITLGVAFEANIKGELGYSVKLNVIPVGWNGDLLLMPPQDDDRS
jgi:hypothetical protein